MLLNGIEGRVLNSIWWFGAKHVTTGLDNIKIHKTASSEARLKRETWSNLTKLGNCVFHIKQLDSPEKGKKGPKARTWADLENSEKPKLLKSPKLHKTKSESKAKTVQIVWYLQKPQST